MALILRLHLTAGCLAEWRVLQVSSSGFLFAVHDYSPLCACFQQPCQSVVQAHIRSGGTDTPDMQQLFVATEVSFLPMAAETSLSAALVVAAHDACNVLASEARYRGRIMLLNRGPCSSWVQIKHAQQVGAVGVLISNLRDDVVPPSEGPRITAIPTFLVSRTDGRALADLLRTNATITVTFAASRRERNDMLVSFDEDTLRAKHIYTHALSLSGLPSHKIHLFRYRRFGHSDGLVVLDLATTLGRGRNVHAGRPTILLAPTTFNRAFLLFLWGILTRTHARPCRQSRPQATVLELRAGRVRGARPPVHVGVRRGVYATRQRVRPPSAPRREGLHTCPPLLLAAPHHAPSLPSACSHCTPTAEFWPWTCLNRPTSVLWPSGTYSTSVQ